MRKMTTEPRQRRQTLLRLWLIIAIITGFGIVLFFVINYVNEVMLCDINCAVRNDVAIALVLSGLVGVFVGSITFYFISDKYERKIVQLHSDASASLRFLDVDERKIIKELIDADGNRTQSELVLNTEINRVKLSRLLQRLVEKGLITKSQQGMTNNISLDKEILSVFKPQNKEKND